MSAFAAIAARDLRLALRGGADALTLVLFFVMAAAVMPFAIGPKPSLRDYIEPLARHGSRPELVDGRPTKIRGRDTLLVPGVPATPDQSAALDALHAWLKWIGKKPPVGVEILAS